MCTLVSTVCVTIKFSTDTRTHGYRNRRLKIQELVQIAPRLRWLCQECCRIYTCKWHLRANIDSTYEGANLSNADYNYIFQTTREFNSNWLGRNTASLLIASGRNFLMPTLLTELPSFDKHRLMGQIQSTPPFCMTQSYTMRTIIRILSQHSTYTHV